MSNRPDWTFAGTLTVLDRRTTKGGKEFAQLVIERTDGKYTNICVCDLWSDVPAGIAEGAQVEAAGRMSGREYNGKHYAGLTALRVERVGAQADDGAQDDEPVDPGLPMDETDGMPF